MVAGFSVSDLHRITLESGFIYSFFLGLAIWPSCKTTICGSDVHSVEMVGMSFAKAQKDRNEDTNVHEVFEI